MSKEYNFAGFEAVEEEQPQPARRAAQPRQARAAPQPSKASAAPARQSRQPTAPARQTRATPAKPAQKAQPKKEVAQEDKAKFNNKTLLHYLNSCYNNFRFRDFKNVSEEKKSMFKVNMSEFTALKEFKRLVEEFDEDEAIRQRKNEKPRKKEEKWNEITHAITDFKLRGILTIINDINISIKNEDGTKDTKIFTNYILPQLHFNEPEPFNISILKDKIKNFLTSDKLKFKLYNAMFPHPQMETKEGAKDTKLSCYYLQNMSNYHDAYLELLYSGKVKSADDLYNLAAENIAKESKKLINVDDLLTLSFDKEAAKKEAKLSEEEKKYYKMARFEHAVADRYFKCYQLAIEQNLTTLKEAKANYDAYNKKLDAFAAHADQIDKVKIDKLEKFIKLFIDEFTALNEDLKYNNSIKNYIADIGASDSLIFTQRFKQILMKVIKGENIKITYDNNAKTFSCSINMTTRKTDKNGEKIEQVVNRRITDHVIQEQRHTFENTRDTLAKIGHMVRSGIDKNIRVALGIAIIDFIYNTTTRITEKSKLPKKTVYINFDTEEQ